ncbi:chemotaxis protein CheD [Neorhizobium alkalisoli]|uniref:Probable chemoreceptor glutamine deamidase CheD n=1 Tax=Neorhizobium alkalisoli TaxID=528178 RepID=A0A561QWZ5_9HYPH|nr:chemotaxis protein CheD [Neorhizobium alkalisoli]TWF54878.1 chemotaxis protein CheD [Neorhizobium alkalisoli]
MDISGFRPIHVLGGQLTLSSRPDTMLITVLGSCVSACIYDPVAGIGGMNHFILPTGGNSEPGQRQRRYGDVAMRNLVDGLYKRGAEPGRLMAKLYGGRARTGGSGQAGSLNAAFAQDFLMEEGIDLIDASLGEDFARWVTFHPASGWVRLKERADRQHIF